MGNSIGQKLNLKVAIIVSAGANELPDFCLNSEFLSKFSLKALLGRLANFNLATRELPFVGKAGTFLAPGNEDLAVLAVLDILADSATPDSR